MKKKNLGILCASLALCGTAIFGSYAWLVATADEKFVNHFETTTDSSKITIVLSEPAFSETVKEDAKDYIPGDVFAKDPTVENTSQKESLFAAIKVTYKLNRNQRMHQVTQEEFNTIAKLDKINTGWKLIGKDATGAELYMYETALNKNEKTPALFNSVNINKELITGQNIPFDIVVEAFGTQAANADAAEVKASLINLAGVEAVTE